MSLYSSSILLLTENVNNKNSLLLENCKDFKFQMLVFKTIEEGERNYVQR